MGVGMGVKEALAVVGVSGENMNVGCEGVCGRVEMGFLVGGGIEATNEWIAGQRRIK